MSIEEQFKDGLNQHGYPFQYRVIHEIVDIASTNETRWSVLGIEIPVSASNKSTRIDLLLVDLKERDKCFFAVVECKRVNPAFGTWCFSKAPHTIPEWSGTQIIAEYVFRRKKPEVFTESAAFGVITNQPIYSIGFVLKCDKKGDSHPVSKDNDGLEKACEQVCKGMNGLIDSLETDERMGKDFKEYESIGFLPVIITTADLYTSDIDLRSADLGTGEIEKLKNTSKVDWLLYQYPTSSNIKHSVTRGGPESDSFTGVFTRDFYRSIAIVNPSGIKSFIAEQIIDPTAWPTKILLGGL